MFKSNYEYSSSSHHWRPGSRRLSSGWPPTQQKCQPRFCQLPAAVMERCPVVKCGKHGTVPAHSGIMAAQKPSQICALVHIHVLRRRDPIRYHRIPLLRRRSSLYDVFQRVFHSPTTYLRTTFPSSLFLGRILCDRLAT